MALTNKTLAQLTKTADTAVATDLMQTSRAGEDYKITFANICQYIWMYLTGTYFVTLTAKNISAGPQTTTLDIYQAGGASEKPNGFRIKVPWTGGNKTYSHTFVATGYNFKLPDGTIVAPSVLVGNGTGDLTFELDKTNSVWKIIDDQRYIYDVFTFTLSTSVTAKISKYIDGKQVCFLNDANLRTTSSTVVSVAVALLSYDITNLSFVTLTEVVVSCTNASGKFVWPGSWSYSAPTLATQMFGVNTSTTGYPQYLLTGTWR